MPTSKCTTYRSHHSWHQQPQGMDEALLFPAPCLIVDLQHLPVHLLLYVFLLSFFESPEQSATNSCHNLFKDVFREKKSRSLFFQYSLNNFHPAAGVASVAPSLTRKPDALAFVKRLMKINIGGGSMHRSPCPGMDLLTCRRSPIRLAVEFTDDLFSRSHLCPPLQQLVRQPITCCEYSSFGGPTSKGSLRLLLVWRLARWYSTVPILLPLPL